MKKEEKLLEKAEKMERIYLEKKRLWEEYKISADDVEEAYENARTAWREYGIANNYE